MKKILIKIFLILTILFSFWAVSNIYAADTSIVQVSAKIPGWNCIYNAEDRVYDCEIWRWFGAFMYLMWEMLKYITFLAGLFSVLALVIGWMMYSMWWANENLKTTAKTYMEKSLIWLVLLLLSWTILYMLAPWVYV